MLLEALAAKFIVAAISIIAGSSDVKGTMMAILLNFAPLTGILWMRLCLCHLR